MDRIQILEFDSEIFGLKVAKLVPDRLDLASLGAALDLLKAQDVKLVYWAADSTDPISQQAAKAYQGFLADKKTTYIIDFDQLADYPAPVWDVTAYPETEPDAFLIQLALESGLYSRFKTDPRITKATFQAIYTRWIKNSTLKRIAKQVLVIRGQEQVIGMVTLGEKHGRGDIGLLAVAEQARGNQLGLHLVRAAQNYFIQEGYRIGQVVTQLENLPACRLYEKCGYQIEKIEYFYHFWL